jgi:hypothetical protein
MGKMQDGAASIVQAARYCISGADQIELENGLRRLATFLLSLDAHCGADGC